MKVWAEFLYGRKEAQPQVGRGDIAKELSIEPLILWPDRHTVSRRPFQEA